MKKIILLLIMALPLLLKTAPVFSDINTPEESEIEVKATGKDTWSVYHATKGFIATLTREKGNEALKIYDKNERYVGLILPSKSMMPRTARTETTRVVRSGSMPRKSPRAMPPNAVCAIPPPIIASFLRIR